MSDQPSSALVSAPASPRAGGVVICDMDGLARFSKMVFDSGLAPRGFNNPAAIGIAVQHGLELGLAPLQALQSIAVINGKPGIYGDAALALVRCSGQLEWIKEEVRGGKSEDDCSAICTTKRVGDPEPKTSTFSIKDAKRAGLWNKAGPWTQYPQRMLMFRARTFNLRDNFPDILRGLTTVEELRDYPQDRAAPARVVNHVETASPQLPPPTKNDDEIIEQPDPNSHADETLDLDIKDTIEDFQNRIATAEKGFPWTDLGDAISKTEGLIGKVAVENLLAALRERKAQVDPAPTRSGKQRMADDIRAKAAAQPLAPASA